MLTRRVGTDEASNEKDEPRFVEPFVGKKLASQIQQFKEITSRSYSSHYCVFPREIPSPDHYKQLLRCKMVERKVYC